MKSDAIAKATVALHDRLKSALKSGGVGGDVFVGPLDDPASRASPLTLFLYRITPNPSLRNREHRVSSAAQPPVIVHQNSLPLDLCFLLTVGANPGVPDDPLLKALGLAMQDLQAAPDLTGPDVGYETVRVTLESLTTEEASRIWSLFPTANYRTSIALLASPVWIDPAAPTTEAAAVTDASLSGRKPEEAGR